VAVPVLVLAMVICGCGLQRNGAIHGDILDPFLQSATAAIPKRKTCTLSAWV
jgi:hypothetical protein